MMPGLQEFIHKFEEGEGAKYIRRLLIIFLVVGLAALYDVREFKGFSTIEAMDSAQLGRNIADGEGFTTKFVRPLSIKLMQNHNGAAFNPLTNALPDISNPPVFPLIEAAVLKIAPAVSDGLGKVSPSLKDTRSPFAIREVGFTRYMPEMWIAILNQVIFGFLLWSLFVLGRKIFDASVGATTATVVALTEIFWRFSISGLSTIFLMVILVWMVWCLADLEVNAREKKGSPGRFFAVSFLLAALLAVGVLTRYSFGWLIAPVIGFAAAFLGGQRVKTIGVVAVVFVLALGPWCFRNYQVCGRLFGTAGLAHIELTLYQPENHLQRSMPQNLDFELNRVGVDQYVKKLLLGVGETIQKELPNLGGSWVTALFLVGLLAPFQNPGLGRLRYFLVASMVVLIAVQSIGRTALWSMSPEINSENLLILAAPLVFMFGVALFFAFLDQALFEFPQYRRAAISAFVVVMSLPLFITYLPPNPYPVAYPPYYPPRLYKVAASFEPNEMLMSDMPWAVAWYGNRQCAWTTLDAGNGAPYDFYAIHDYLKPVKALYLTPITMDQKFLSEFLKSNESAWSRFALDTMVRTNIPGGFPLMYAPNGFLPDFLLLTDRKRF